jgi:membrane-associated protease RseP (regulator of RpoE activity)
MALFNMLPLPSLDGDIYFYFLLKALVYRFHTSSHTLIKDDQAAVDNDTNMELGARASSRPDSPTQLRRPSNARFTLGRDSRLSESGVGLSTKRSNDQTIAKIKKRFQWFVIFLAVFVFGGSILLHAVKEGAD